VKVINISQNTDEWFDFRRGKISGSKLKDLCSKRGGRKKGFYQLIADRLEEAADYEDPRERGHRLEDEGLAEFEKKYGLEVNKDCGIWQSDLNPNLIVSPDGGIEIDGEYVAAVEMKCLGGANHVQAVIENKIPDDYWEQAIQYFVINEKLETLYFTFYHPLIPSVKLHVIELKRADMEEYAKEMETFELKQLEEIEKIVAELAF
jgi:hypothetical protein